MRSFILAILMFYSSNMIAQSVNDKMFIARKIFENLVNAYGSSKTPPELKILPRTNPKIVAQYVTNPSPIVQIDEDLYDLCLSFGKVANDALAVILSHELAHYYNDHTWCSDYAFAFRNSSLGKTLYKISKESKIEKESIADSYGLFYAAVAGYNPFDIFNQLLDKIYRRYKLPETMSGYPSKNERKEINRIQKGKIEKLVPVFEAGVILIYAGKYEDAITCFTYLNKFFPSRENYNNLGTAKLRWAIQLKPQQAIEFIYPVEIDPVSRLNNNNTRNSGEDTQTQIQDLLQSAKKDFEKAISLDPNYSKAYINLACVYDLLGNYEAAIGRINDMPTNQNDKLSSLEIKAIAYAHADNSQKAEETFLQIQKLSNDSSNYNYRIFVLSKQSLLASETFKQQWLNKYLIDSSQLGNIKEELTRIRNIEKQSGKETVTQINDHPLFSIKNIIRKNSQEMVIQTQSGNIALNKYLLSNTETNSTHEDWKVINRQPLMIQETTNKMIYIITVN